METWTQSFLKKIKEKKRGGKTFVPLRCLMQIKNKVSNQFLCLNPVQILSPTHIKYAPEEASSASSFLVLIFYDEEASQREPAHLSMFSCLGAQKSGFVP